MDLRQSFYDAGSLILAAWPCHLSNAGVEPHIVEPSISGQQKPGASPEVETNAEAEAEAVVAIGGIKIGIPRKMSEQLLQAKDEVKLGQDIQRGRRASQRLEDIDAIGMNNAAFDGKIISRTTLEEYVAAGDTAFWQFVRANKALVGWSVRVLYRAEFDFFDRAIDNELLDEVIAHIYTDKDHGLLRAVKDFDPTIGNKFCTYAVFWIRKSLQMWIAQNMQIPINLYAYRKLQKLRGMQSSTSQTIVSDEIKAYANYRCNSLDDVVKYGDKETSWQELVADPRSTLAETAIDTRLTLAAALGRLTSLQRQIITREFGLDAGEPQTPKKQAIELGLSMARLDVQRNAAMKVLKSQLAALLE
jgi:hypothetical protein